MVIEKYREEMLQHLEEQIQNCTKCHTQKGKSAVGFGKMDNPSIFFLGINPWVNDNKFVYGKGITILMANLNKWDFTDFYFDNVVKCEMPDRGKPSALHAMACREFLTKQIAIINPKMIITFGQFAHQRLPRNITIPTVNLPHFSSVLYLNSSKAIDEYYKKLHDTIKNFN